MLVAAVVVIVNVVFNRRNEGFPVCECVPVVTFSFEDAPEAFHRAIVNAATHTRHTLRHASIQQFFVKSSAGILVSSVTVEQWVRIRIFQNCFVKGVKDQIVVVAVAETVTDNPTVA